MVAKPVFEQLPVSIERDFDYLLSFIPRGWKEHAEHLNHEFSESTRMILIIEFFIQASSYL
jgi:hypothetical protein